MNAWPQMRTLFPGYFRLSDDELAKLWEDAFFVFDANVLLNVYRYSPAAKAALKQVFNVLQGRMWVPFQAAEEFQRNRLNVITSQIATYETAIEASTKLLSALRAPRSHPFVAANVLSTTQDA